MQHLVIMCIRSSSIFFFFSSRRRHTRLQGDWSSDVCSSDLHTQRQSQAIQRGCESMGEQRGRLPGDSGESIGSRLSYGCLHTSKPCSVSRGENMQKRFAFCTVFLLSLAVLTAPVLGQGDKSKRPSPPAKADCKFAGGKTITVDYSSPRMNGRKIYGGVGSHPPGWGTRADETTTFFPPTQPTPGGQTPPTGGHTTLPPPHPNHRSPGPSKK